MENIEDLKQQLESLKALRHELSVKEEKPINTNDNKKEQIKIIDSEIKELELDLKKTAKEYEESCKKLKLIIEEYQEKTEATKLLTEEEIKDLRENVEKAKLDENERSIKILRRLNELKKIIRELKTKKTKMENNIRNAEALGLTEEEYNAITYTLNKTTIMNAILNTKGLQEIIDKKASDRTNEEKEALKKAKEEILKEVAETKKENKNSSILEIIEALYSIETKYKKSQEPKITTLKTSELLYIAENSQKLPYRIVNSNDKNKNYKPEATPKDMEGADNNNVDINELKPAEERVTVFKDSNTNDYYARKYAVNRFKLKSAILDNEVKINGSVCYQISEKDVAKIKDNANNAFSPYIADIKEITLDKELTEQDIKEVIEESFKATNIESSEEFKEELSTGNVLYNIVNKIPQSTKKMINKSIGKEEITLDSMLEETESEEEKGKEKIK